MRVIYALCAAALAAIPAAAQPIQGHPQKAFYASSAEWPELFDGQLHWDKLDPLTTQHCVHFVPKFPYLARLDDTAFDVRVTMKMFHCAAQVTANFIGDLQVPVTWDNGVTYPVKGKPDQLLTFTGTMRFDPKKLGRFHHQHGWTGVRFNTSIVFDSGDVAYHSVWTSYFSIVDTSAPEDIAPGGFGQILSVRDMIFPVSGVGFGDMVLEIVDPLPLLPINAPWFFRVNAYNYTSIAPCCPNGMLEQRRDMDFHAGVPGQMIVQAPADQQGFSTRVMVLDPATMPKGAHKDGLFWKSTFQGQTIASFLAVSYVVGDGVPAPTLCLDPLASNVGGPLPCVYPTPVPGVFTPTFRMDGATLFICTTSNPVDCKALVLKP